MLSDGLNGKSTRGSQKGWHWLPGLPKQRPKKSNLNLLTVSARASEFDPFLPVVSVGFSEAYFRTGVSLPPRASLSCCQFDAYLSAPWYFARASSLWPYFTSKFPRAFIGSAT